MNSSMFGEGRSEMRGNERRQMAPHWTDSVRRAVRLSGWSAPEPDMPTHLKDFAVTGTLPAFTRRQAGNKKTRARRKSQSVETDPCATGERSVATKHGNANSGTGRKQNGRSNKQPRQRIDRKIARVFARPVQVQANTTCFRNAAFLCGQHTRSNP